MSSCLHFAQQPLSTPKTPVPCCRPQLPPGDSCWWEGGPRPAGSQQHAWAKGGSGHGEQLSPLPMSSTCCPSFPKVITKFPLRGVLPRAPPLQPSSQWTPPGTYVHLQSPPSLPWDRRLPPGPCLGREAGASHTPHTAACSPPSSHPLRGAAGPASSHQGAVPRNHGKWSNRNQCGVLALQARPGRPLPMPCTHPASTWDPRPSHQECHCLASFCPTK